MGKKQVTSLKIDEDIWKKAKIKAINQGIQLSDVLEEAVLDWLKKQKSR